MPRNHLIGDSSLVVKRVHVFFLVFILLYVIKSYFCTFRVLPYFPFNPCVRFLQTINRVLSASFFRLIDSGVSKIF